MEEVTQPVLAKSRRRPSTRLIVWGVVLILMLSVSGYFLYLISQPAQGVVTTTVTTTATKVVQSPRTVRGKATSFKYPADIQAVQPDVLAVGDVEKFLFIRSQLSAWSLAIQVKRLPSGNLSDDSSYNLRRQNPAQYSEQQMKINGLPVTVMSNTASSDKVAFLLHNGLVAEVAVSGTSKDDARSEAAFTLVLNSWEWLP